MDSVRAAEAERVAAEVFAEHGLDGWTFQWDRAKKRFGQCCHDTRTISLSRVLTELNDEADVLDTIRHEVAHALAGPGAGHGRKWIAQCYVTGATPRRCGDYVTAPQRYTIRCEKCGVTGTRDRKPRSKAYHRTDGGLIIWTRQEAEA